MKTLYLLAIILPVLISCKKEKKTTDTGPSVYVRFTHNGTFKRFEVPGCDLTYSLNIPSWGMETFTNPPEGFSVYLDGHTENRIYAIVPDEDPKAELLYGDTSGNIWTLYRGVFELTESDSLRYHYKGKFSGVFIREDGLDSFSTPDGELYFKGKN